MITILIVEDEKNVRRLYEDTLRDEGHKVLSAPNGKIGLDMYYDHHVDLVLVDIMMPEMDGLTLTKTLREHGAEIPMIMISARDEPKSKKDGFVAGVDDYMVKPVDLDELILRIRAILKRSKIAAERKLVIGNVELNYESFSVNFLKTKEVIELPKKEFLLIFKLLSYPNKIFTRNQLMDEIWGYDTDSDENTINVHINKLRNRFKDVKEFDIITVRGLGYKAHINEEKA